MNVRRKIIKRRVKLNPHSLLSFLETLKYCVYIMTYIIYIYIDPYLSHSRIRMCITAVH